MPERYLRLGLQLGRHVEGMVDAYFGPAELAAAVEAEPPVDPRILVADAEALLDELEDGWLRDQVVGLRTYAGVLAGESGSYADEVEGCYGVRPTHTDEAVFAAAHERLDELLPGDGPLAERYERWRTSILVPTEQVERTVAAVIEEARVWTRRWSSCRTAKASTWRSSATSPGWRSTSTSAACAAGSPSTSTSRCRPSTCCGSRSTRRTPATTRSAPARSTCSCAARGLLEETIVLVPTPQSLVSEGIAELAPAMLLEGEAGPALAAVLADAGIEFDLAHALAVDRAREPCHWAEVNAALMLHEEGASEAEVKAYLERWGLLTPELAAHLIRFLTEPTSRSYMITYSAGRELCRAYVAGEPERFRRLLTEQVRVGDLLAARDTAHVSP